jgi:hypothetical protein
MNSRPSSSVSLALLLLLVAPANGNARQEPKPPQGGHYGTGRPGTGGPTTYAARRGATATPRGTTEQTEHAVLEGLCWLLRHQNEDGSWGESTLAAHCDAGQPCIRADAALDSAHDEGLTALALLAFLGAGFSGSKTEIAEITDALTGKTYVARDNVAKGIEWLKGRPHEDGAREDATARLPLYDDVWTAMALCEAYGMSANRTLKEPAQRAIERLVAAQQLDPQGARSGWGDLPTTMWAVLALVSARMSGLAVADGVLEGGLAYAHSVGGADGVDAEPLSGGASTDPASAFRRHAVFPPALNMLVRTLVVHDVTDPFLAATAARLLVDAPKVSADKSSIDYAYWHVASLALWQFDGPGTPRTPAGKFWSPWNEKLVAALLSLQDDGAHGGCHRGGWLQDDDTSRRAGHALYATALNVLTLETYYRYPNVFRVKK